MRAPQRTRRSAPKRRTGPSRPACIARTHPNRYVEQQVARGFLNGLDTGISLAREHKAKDAIARFLQGEQDPDLMTRQELGDLAILLTKMAAEVVSKRLRVPIEPYLLAQMSPKDREWYERCQGDGDIDDEDGAR